MIKFISAMAITLTTLSAQAYNPNTVNRLDVATFNILNNEATAVSAQKSQQSPKSADALVKNFYQNVLQFLATSEIQGNLLTIKQLSDTDEMQSTLDRPLSPLLHQALIDIAITRALQMQDRIHGFFSVGEDSTFRHSVWCVVGTQCAEGLAPKYARTDEKYRTWVRQFIIAKYFLAAKFDNICASSLNVGNTLVELSFLKTLSVDEDGWSLSLYNPAEIALFKFADCRTEGTRSTYQTEKDVAKSAKKHIQD